MENTTIYVMDEWNNSVEANTIEIIELTIPELIDKYGKEKFNIITTLFERQDSCYSETDEYGLLGFAKNEKGVAELKATVRKKNNSEIAVENKDKEKMNAKENENVRACTMDAQKANTKAVKIPLFECGDSVCDIDHRMRWKVVNIMNFNKKGEIKYQCVDDLNGSIRAYIPESKLYPLSPVSDRDDMKLLLDLLQPLIESAKEKHSEYVKYCGSSEPMDSGPCDYLNQIKRIHDRLYLCYTRDYPGRPKSNRQPQNR